LIWRLIVTIAAVAGFFLAAGLVGLGRSGGWHG
jgi:hypothetical protein